MPQVTLTLVEWADEDKRVVTLPAHLVTLAGLQSHAAGGGEGGLQAQASQQAQLLLDAAELLLPGTAPASVLRQWGFASHAHGEDQHMVPPAMLRQGWATGLSGAAALPPKLGASFEAAPGAEPDFIKQVMKSDQKPYTPAPLPQSTALPAASQPAAKHEAAAGPEQVRMKVGDKAVARSFWYCVLCVLPGPLVDSKQGLNDARHTHMFRILAAVLMQSYM